MSGDIIKKLEEYSDSVLRKTKDYLPFLSRLCLVATFLEVMIVTSLMNVMFIISIYHNLTSMSYIKPKLLIFPRPVHLFLRKQGGLRSILDVHFYIVSDSGECQLFSE